MAEGLVQSAVVAPRVAAKADEYRDGFQGAKPFRHLVVDGFLDDAFARALVRDFPRFDPERAKNEFGEVGGKAVHEHLAKISPAYSALHAYLISESFLSLMSRMTGIADLRPDPTMFGGGTHENKHGQDLDPHIDFNYDPKTKLHRQLNLLVYLNEEWASDWGGAIELHSNPRRPRENKITAFDPIFNRAVMFETNEHSWHGFPRIELPEDKRHLSRKSISVYLYTRERPEDEIVAEHGTFYVQRGLPHYFQPGRTLAPEDIDLIYGLFFRRDSWIEFYQNAEIRKSGDIGHMQQRIAQQEARIAELEARPAEGGQISRWMRKVVGR